MCDYVLFTLCMRSLLVECISLLYVAIFSVYVVIFLQGSWFVRLSVSFFPGEVRLHPI